MMAVEVAASEKFQAGVPKALFVTRFAANFIATWFDVTKDGHFLIPNQVEEPAVVPISIVINWTAGLKK